MKRSEFLKRLGVGIVAIPLVPKIAAEAAEIIKDIQIEEAGMTGDEIVNEIVRGGEKDINEVMDIWKKTGDLIYSHYEEPWIHDAHPWPLMMNDTILLPNEKVYIVTEVHYGKAILTPIDAQDEVIIVHKGDEMIRFASFREIL